MTVNVERRESLPADARSVREARSVVRTVLSQSEHRDRDEWAERATLAVSELVTNAVVHAGTTIELSILLSSRSLRVEIADRSPQAPSTRTHAVTAVTGRGLHLVDSSVDRWDIETHPDGKVVWFEIGEAERVAAEPDPDTEHPDDLAVVLRRVPLLIHMAWQEQISALLREYLLYRLEDDPAVLEQHARASAAMTLLHEQLPAPVLQDRPEEIMRDAAGPAITAEEVVLRVPRTALADFDALEALIDEAVAVARTGDLLANPTQPEVTAWRRWLCAEVRRQAAGGPGTEPVPFAIRTDLSARPDVVDPRLRALGDSEEPLVIADEELRMAAVTPAMLALLGYRDESELLGRRVHVVVPPRYHQAKIAGIAFHLTNGRSGLLDVDIQVPVVRADGTEQVVGLVVEPHVLDGGLRAFVARFRALD